MKLREGDTFWLHICPHKTEFREYILTGVTCKTCDWEELTDMQKTKIRHEEYRERLEQDVDY